MPAGVIMAENGEHQRITDAGWAYRTNDRRGWVIYRDPQTRTWHTQSEAMFILQARVPNGIAPRLTDGLS